MADRPIQVVQVNSTDDGGGAASVARLLHQGQPRDAVESRFFVGRCTTPAAGISALEPGSGEPAWRRFWSGLQGGLTSPSLASRAGALACRALADPGALLERLAGHEDLRHPASHRLLDLPEPQPELLHLHNLHGDYFDLELLPRLTRAK